MDEFKFILISPRSGPPFDYSHFVPYAQGPAPFFLNRDFGLNKNTLCFYSSQNLPPCERESGSLSVGSEATKVEGQSIKSTSRILYSKVD